MDPVTALTTVATVLNTIMEVAPVVVQGISDLKTFATTLYEKLSGQTITDDQRATLEAQIDALHTEFQAAIPPDDQQ